MTNIKLPTIAIIASALSAVFMVIPFFGKLIAMPCAAIGIGLGTFSWFKDDQKILSAAAVVLALVVIVMKYVIVTLILCALIAAAYFYFTKKSSSK